MDSVVIHKTRSEKIADRVTGLIEKVCVLRSIDKPEEKFSIEVIQHLCKDLTYDNLKMTNAERWCERGDWTGKGKEQRLTLQDFYPTKAQLESIKTDDYVLISRVEYAQALNKAKQAGILDGKTERIEEGQNINIHKLDYERAIKEAERVGYSKAMTEKDEKTRTEVEERKNKMKEALGITENQTETGIGATKTPLSDREFGYGVKNEQTRSKTGRYTQQVTVDGL